MRALTPFCLWALASTGQKWSHAHTILAIFMGPAYFWRSSTTTKHVSPKLSQHFGVISQCKIREPHVWGPRAKEKEPSLQGWVTEDSKTEKNEQHALANDFDALSILRDANVNGFKASAERWGIQTQNSHTFGQPHSQHFGDMSQCWRISGLHCLGLHKGSLPLVVPRLSDGDWKLKNLTILAQWHTQHCITFLGDEEDPIFVLFLSQEQGIYFFLGLTLRNLQTCLAHFWPMACTTFFKFMNKILACNPKCLIKSLALKPNCVNKIHAFILKWLRKVFYKSKMFE